LGLRPAMLFNKRMLMIEDLEELKIAFFGHHAQI